MREKWNRPPEITDWIHVGTLWLVLLGTFAIQAQAGVPTPWWLWGFAGAFPIAVFLLLRWFFG